MQNLKTRISGHQMSPPGGAGCTSQTFSTPLASRCKMLSHFSVDNQHFGGIEEAPHTTCDRSTHRATKAKATAAAAVARLAAQNWHNATQISD